MLFVRGEFFSGPGHAWLSSINFTYQLFFVGAFVDVEKVDERVSIVYTRRCVVCYSSCFEFW